MKEFIKSVARLALRPIRQTIVPISQTYEFDRKNIFRERAIDLVVDVGANVGQYATALRRDGYKGNLISIEPLPDAFSLLQNTMANDPRWQGYQFAAGSEEGVAEINVSADSVCSSLLQPSKSLTDAIETAKTVRRIEVPVRKVDDIDFPEFRNAVLKLDVQGFERHAINGARDLISKIRILEVELSIKSSYEEAYTFSEALPEIFEMGFEILTIGRGYSDKKSGHLIDVDVLFCKIE